jgi:hypothetical protein
MWKLHFGTCKDERRSPLRIGFYQWELQYNVPLTYMSHPNYIQPPIGHGKLDITTILLPHYMAPFRIGKGI